MEYKLLSVAECAEKSGLSRKKIRAWIKRGILPAVDISDGLKPCFRIRELDLESAIGSQVMSRIRKPVPRASYKRYV